MTTFGFPRSIRLLRRKEFLRFRGRHRRAHRYLVFETIPGRGRLGITVTKKYGNAVARNRFKRLVREAYRLSRHQLPNDLDILVRPRSEAREAQLADILKEFLVVAGEAADHPAQKGPDGEGR